MRVKTVTYYAEVNKDGKSYLQTVKTGCTLNEVSDYLKKQGYSVEKIVSSETHHLCKYCHGIAEGTYDDLLCEECREVFGHSLYSEL